MKAPDVAVQISVDADLAMSNRSHEVVGHLYADIVAEAHALTAWLDASQAADPVFLRKAYESFVVSVNSLWNALQPEDRERIVVLPRACHHFGGGSSLDDFTQGFAETGQCIPVTMRLTMPWDGAA